MLRQTGLLIAIFFSGFAAGAQQHSPGALHEHREAASDLEVTGLLRGVPRGESRFVSRAWIAGLPQSAVRMAQNDDFPGVPKAGVMVSGVPLDELARRLGSERSVSAIEAVCGDGYTATYSQEYIRQHRPLVVLTIAGLSLHRWAIEHRQYDAGPYFIGYGSFTPAFHVLSHKDQPLEPTGILELRFGTEEQVFADIAPIGTDGPTATTIEQGYRIARQNCLRCHNAGEHGGTKAAKSWSDLGIIAKNRPEHFDAWVKDPQSIDARAEMPANPTYDKATLTALQRYFAAFAVEAN